MIKAIGDILNNLWPNNIERCKCSRKCEDYCDSIELILNMTKTNRNFNKERSKKAYYEHLQVTDDTMNISEKNIKQIIKDLNRTYPNNKMFKSEETQIKLKNVLRAFSNHDRQICYFQGMNFIVGFFLYHCDEYVAFWLFVALFDEYDFREIFTNNFSKLYFHTNRVNMILKRNYSNLYEAFNKLKVNLDVFIIEWLYSLFSSIIPLETQLGFYNGFFLKKWEFFYKMCISAFLSLEGEYNDASEIYMELKDGKFEFDEKEAQVKKWEKIINRAYQISFSRNEDKLK